MPRGAGWIRVWLVAERIKVQRFDDLAALVSDQPRAALAVFVDVQRFALSLFADELSHAIGGVRVARFLPRPTVLFGSLQHDFTVGPCRIQNPLRFFFLCAGFFGSADSSAQRVIAVAHCGAAIAGLHEPVITAPRVADGLRRRLLFEQVAPSVPAVGGFLACGRLFFCELVQAVVGVAGFLAVAVFFRAVACAVVAVAANAGRALGGDAFFGELAVSVVFPRFVRELAANFFRSLGQAPLGIALIAESGQSAAVGFLVMDLSQLACGVVVVVAAGAIGALDSGDAPDCVVAEVGAALVAGQALQPAACVPAGADGLGRFRLEVGRYLCALAGRVPNRGALSVRAGFAGLCYIFD